MTFFLQPIAVLETYTPRGVSADKIAIMGKLDGTRMTKQAKSIAWEAVIEAVSVVSPARRSAEEVRNMIFIPSSRRLQMEDKKC